MALAAESAVSIAFALLTRRLIRFRGALSERAVASLEQLEEFGFGAADLIFDVPGLHGLGERDHHFRQKVQGLQMATGCLVYQLCEARFNLGHPLRTIVSLGQNFLFRNLPPAILGFPWLFGVAHWGCQNALFGIEMLWVVFYNPPHF